jgi:hypothetical protein
MPYTEEQYQRAKSAVSAGAIPQDKLPVVAQRIAEFEGKPQGMGNLRAMESANGPLAVPPDVTTSQPATQKPVTKAHKSQFDMGNSSVIDYLGTVANDDPKRREMVENVRRATEDESLPNSSKLKALNAPTEWKPKQIQNPFSSLPVADKDKQYFYEPSLEQFKEAISSGALSKQLEREFPGQKGEIPPEWLEGSKTFKAYKDAAWKHELAAAMKENRPIVRVEFSKDIGPLEKLQAEGLDKATSFATGALSGASMGTADPVIRAVAPEGAEAERRSRMRNPTAAFVGEVAGSLSPIGLPGLLAKGVSKGLGYVGLGNKGVSGLAKSTVAGGLTGAADANIRAIAQSAADALDAGESMAEAAGRIYDTVASQQTLERALAGGAIGAGMGAGGHVVGSLADKGARAVVGGDAMPILQHGAESGVGMSKLGGPVLPKDLELKVSAANAQRANADDLLAESSIEPMAAQRLTEQENLASRAEADTVMARERLAGATVPTGPMADEIKRIAAEMPAATPQGQAASKNLRRFAQRLARREKLSPEEIDNFMAEVDAQAKQATGKPDPVWNKVSAVLKGGRDDLGEATAVDNFAIRDKFGEKKAVSGYSGMKTRQSNEQRIQEFENRQMGLPEKLKGEPVEIGRSSATDEEAGAFLGQEPELARVQRFLNEDRAVASRLERGNTPQDLTPERVSNAIESAAATNRALRKAVDQGYVHDGVIYRGAALTPEQASKIISDGTVTSDSVWSAAKDRSYAEGFASKAAKRGREPVVFEIEGPAGVPLDQIPGSNTFQELGIPVGERFNVLDSYRDQNGALVVKLGSTRPTADDMTTAAKPKARLDFPQRSEFKGKILGTADPANAVSSEKLKALAERAGVLNNIKDIQRLRDSQNWKQYLGRIINGISVSPGGGGGSYVKSNQLLRAAPTLKSLSGGLPEMEASPQAVEAVDKLLRNLVPEVKLGEVSIAARGGQSARPAGAINSRDGEKKLRDDMTEEEAQFALQVIKNILATEGSRLRKAQ